MANTRLTGPRVAALYPAGDTASPAPAHAGPAGADPCAKIRNQAKHQSQVFQHKPLGFIQCTAPNSQRFQDSIYRLLPHPRGVSLIPCGHASLDFQADIPH